MPLLPGGTSEFAIYTSYSNDIMVDIAHLAGTLTAADFEFRVGNDSDTASQSLAAAPTSVTVRPGAGNAGSDRMTITCPNGEIRNTWLQVTVKATAATGLDVDDVFYYGNAVGENGDAPTANLFVNSTDRTIATQ